VATFASRAGEMLGSPPWVDGYRKADVLWPDPIPADRVPADSFASGADDVYAVRWMAVLDAANRRDGRSMPGFFALVSGWGWMGIAGPNGGQGGLVIFGMGPFGKRFTAVLRTSLRHDFPRYQMMRRAVEADFAGFPRLFLPAASSPRDVRLMRPKKLALIIGLLRISVCFRSADCQTPLPGRSRLESPAGA
jgi:hypothetical protein